MKAEIRGITVKMEEGATKYYEPRKGKGMGFSPDLLEETIPANTLT